MHSSKLIQLHLGNIMDIHEGLLIILLLTMRPPWIGQKKAVALISIGLVEIINNLE